MEERGELYLFDYQGEVRRIGYQNPIEILKYFGNIPKSAVEWVLARTLFYKEEKAKRQAIASKEQADAHKKAAEAEDKHEPVIQKKLKSLEMAHKLRQKLIKDGVDPEEANKMIGALLHDQRAQLLLPSPDKAA
jgi:hypothetical protein